jgi:hypothetical protein
MTHRKNRHHSYKKKKRSKNILNKTIDTSVSFTKSTSKKYMPKVKSGLENVGSNVIDKGTKTIPFLQRMTRKFFGLFSKNKTKKHRKH